ncbi:unnamed protein product, partial [Ectocarpus fasciculatus]
GGFGILRNPLASRSSRLGGAAGMAGIAVGGGGVARGGPPETPVMAVMETVRWIAGLDAGISGPPDSLLDKLKKCATVSPSQLQHRLAGLMAKLDGPAAQQQNAVNSLTSSFRAATSSLDARGSDVEAGVVGDAKKKAEALYYSTLEVLLDAETERLGSEDHSRLLEHQTLHKALLACCLEAVLKASSLLSLTFPWVLRRMEIDALDLCKVLESFARFCPGLPMNLKYHLFEVQTEIVERLALETGAGVFRLIEEHKAAGEWPVPPLRETDVAPPTGSHMAGLPCSPQKVVVDCQQQAKAGKPASSLDEPEAAGEEATAAAAAAATATVVKGEEAEVNGSSDGAVPAGQALTGTAAAAAAAGAARARASTLDLFFRRLMKRAAEVVAELCLRRLHLPGDTADQVCGIHRRVAATR